MKFSGKIFHRRNLQSSLRDERYFGIVACPPINGRAIIDGPYGTDLRTSNKNGKLTISHSFVSCLMHRVFSTKHRQPLITPDIASRLWPYIGGIARENNMTALSIGGVEDHIHILLSLPSTTTIAKAIGLRH